MMNFAQKIKKKISEGHIIVGSNVLLSDGVVSDIMAAAGSEFIWIDMEHGPIDYKEAMYHVLGAHAGGAAAFVRVPSNDPDMMKRIMDMGADGIIFPMIRSAKETRMVVEACLYPPEGIRGWNPLAAARYGAIAGYSYAKDSQESFLRIIMLEHIDAYRELDEILTVPGLDGIMLGPCDFSGSRGKLLDIDSPEQLAMFDDAIARCRAAGKFAGIALGCRTGQEKYERWIKAGVQMFSLGQDMDLVYASTCDKIAELRRVQEDMEDELRKSQETII